MYSCSEEGSCVIHRKLGRRFILKYQDFNKYLTIHRNLSHNIMLRNQIQADSRGIMSLTTFSMQPTYFAKLFKKLQFGTTMPIIIIVIFFYKLCKMYIYLNDEKTDMILVYGECLKKTFSAVCVYTPKGKRLLT
jgi:hypothetical protein